MIDKQSHLNKSVLETSRKHFMSGGTIKSLAPKLGVTRKTVYYWKRKYPEYEQCIEWARGSLLYKFEQFELALAVGIDLSSSYPDFRNLNVKAYLNERKRLFPEHFNPKSKRYKQREIEERNLIRA